MLQHVLFSNSPRGQKDFTINFFYENSIGINAAQLACPFFTNTEALEILNKSGCARISLIVRLCGSTSPTALDAVKKMSNVQTRYFTSDSFHAKFYILENVALIGSANLTGGGLKSNRELSVAVNSTNEWFDEIPSLFDELWARAGVLTDHVLKKFGDWHKHHGGRKDEKAIDGVDPFSPETVHAKSRSISRERAYLETYRRQYFETLIPNYRIVTAVYTNHDQRHPSFATTSLKYEVDRFLSWVKLTFTTDETLMTHPILDNQDELRDNISTHVDQWLNTTQSVDSTRIARLNQLTDIFESSETLTQTDYNHLIDSLLGVAAFDEQLRFTKGGQSSLVRSFKVDNDEVHVKENFQKLAFGEGDFVQRTYDSIFDPDLRLAHFGRNCITELFGWINHEDIPPMNGRAIKALRYLGFNVPI